MARAIIAKDGGRGFMARAIIVKDEVESFMARATIQRRPSLRRVARATRRFVRFVQIGQLTPASRPAIAPREVCDIQGPRGPKMSYR